jgi:trehalose 6-phosphate synthase
MTWRPSQGRGDTATSAARPALDLRRGVADRTEGITGRQGAESQRIILVSNRGPVSFSVDPQSGKFESQPGAGGVVSGLLSATRQRPVTWVAVAMSDADRAIARAHEGGEGHVVRDFPNISLRLVDTDEDVYRRYYDGVSNKVLWFIQHYLLQPTRRPLPARTSKDWEEGYRVVNEAVAQTVIDELDAAGDATPVMFHDYHLYLAPQIVREQRPWARLTHFVHIPWPEARYWELAPEVIAQGVFAGLAANDIIGFQTARDARNFLDGAQRFLPDVASASAAPGEVGALLVEGRRVSARVYPIAVAPDEVYEQANAEPDAETAQLLAQARPTPDHKLILRVDRVEPTKNIVAGFRAYERLLQRNKRLRGRVTFLALLVPSREGLAEYRAVMRKTQQAIERINQRYGTDTWQPIIAVFGNDRARALACMRQYDVLLVNPLLDGMNLVVKEGALVNERAGVTILSRTAGAFEQLGDFALGAPPTDIVALSEKLLEALNMSLRERRERSSAMQRLLLKESATSWLHAQLRDLKAQVSRPQVVYRTDTVAPRRMADLPSADTLARETLMAARHALPTPANSASEAHV